MKLLRGDGRVLEVYEAPRLLARYRAGAYPIKENGWRIVSDDEARRVARAALEGRATRDADI